MTDTRDPARWIEAGGPDGFSELVRADEALAPTPAALQRMLAGVAAKLDRPELAQPELPPLQRESPPAQPRQSLPPAAAGAGVAGAGSVITSLAGVLALAIAGGAGVWLSATGPAKPALAPSRSAPPAPAGAPAARPLPRTAAASEQARGEPELERAADRAPSQRGGLETEGVTRFREPIPTGGEARATPVRSRARVAPARPRAGFEPAAELALLERAQRLLAADPAKAFALAERHRRDFAGGTLVQEREVLAIEALIRLGRTGPARKRAAAFQRAHPESSHRLRIEASLRAAR